MILVCDCPFNGLLVMKRILNDQFRDSIGEQIKNKKRSHYKKHIFIMNTVTDEWYMIFNYLCCFSNIDSK